ncbi:polysaccharide deacetylase family sporulation protein PdaB [Amphibacillus sp. Q70]|uniref:polysaccharide deacetylase family sporulation protein PdaB n=1 Tax=Amphibacillus sp. Q70 TaxID=3453416 RepID=UPI003F878F66
MTFFFAFKLNHLKKYFIVLVFGFIVTSLLIFNGNKYLQVFSSEEDPRALLKGNEDRNEIGLTFNITWGDEMLEPILQQLENENVSATFFLLGEWAEHHPHLVDLIAEKGHEIGMLGYRYKSYLELETNEVTKDLYKAKDIFTKLNYPDLYLLRTPSGHLNKEVLTTAVNQGYQVIDWRVNPNDWETPGVNNIVDEVMLETENGDIILMHASDSATQTAEALETILPGLKKKGFQFVTISELITQAEIDTKPIE